jgi:hypothetical protein
MRTLEDNIKVELIDIIEGVEWDLSGSGHDIEIYISVISRRVFSCWWVVGLGRFFLTSGFLIKILYAFLISKQFKTAYLHEQLCKYCQVDVRKCE